MSDLDGFVKKWRDDAKRAANGPMCDGASEYAVAGTYMACADELEAALAQQAGALEYRECGFLIDGPHGTAMVHDRVFIEPKIAALCDNNGDDPDDYTASQLYLRIAPSAPDGVGGGHG